MAQDPDQQLADVMLREQSRLHRFIRRRVSNAQDVEDILQDVFAELPDPLRWIRQGRPRAPGRAPRRSEGVVEVEEDRHAVIRDHDSRLSRAASS
jgi:hypothetical protein